MWLELVLIDANIGANTPLVLLPGVSADMLVLIGVNTPLVLLMC